ncbi:hypothetical protein Kisp01_02790 [Kineosporia sp. NBRC 101677]|nr:hypothetical protein Kisp01_02790 [Kineosporia sp. NBRC 101677]
MCLTSCRRPENLQLTGPQSLTAGSAKSLLSRAMLNGLSRSRRARTPAAPDERSATVPGQNHNGT